MIRRTVPELVVGYGDSDLRAPIGASMPGYFTDRKADGVLDPLRAKAVALRLGEVQGAFVALDLVGLNATEADRCRRAASQATGIPSSAIFIHATHTHTGTMVPRLFTADASDIVPDIYVGEVDPSWVEQLPDRVADAVKTAQRRARASTVDLGQSVEEKIAFYRRFRLKDGKVQTNPGRNNPNVVGPNGEVDPTVTTLRFPAAKTIIVMFGLHPDVIGGTKYSADYPFHLTERIQETLGRDWGVLFLNAACGDINHIDVSNPQQKKGYEESRRIGRALGEAALKGLEKSERIEIDRLGFATKSVLSRLRVVPEEVVKEAERLLKEEPDRAKAFNGLFAPAAVVLGRTREREQRAEIGAARLGPVGLAFMPGEYFVELARIVMHDSPLDPTRVIGLTNGSLGYIPHRAAYEEGGYESGYRSARFQAGTGEHWAQTAVDLLRSLV